MKRLIVEDSVTSERTEGRILALDKPYKNHHRAYFPEKDLLNPRT